MSAFCILHPVITYQGWAEFSGTECPHQTISNIGGHHWSQSPLYHCTTHCLKKYCWQWFVTLNTETTIKTLNEQKTEILINNIEPYNKCIKCEMKRKEIINLSQSKSALWSSWSWYLSVQSDPAVQYPPGCLWLARLCQSAGTRDVSQCLHVEMSQVLCSDQWRKYIYFPSPTLGIFHVSPPQHINPFLFN